jgi:hypothetical protein
MQTNKDEERTEVLSFLSHRRSFLILSLSLSLSSSFFFESMPKQPMMTEMKKKKKKG